MAEIRELSAYEESKILPLYASVGWTNYTQRPEMLREAFAHSLAILGAYDGENLIGLLRAVGDGASVVFVQDLLVCSARQRQGIGSARRCCGHFVSVSPQCTRWNC